MLSCYELWKSAFGSSRKTQVTAFIRDLDYWEADNCLDKEWSPNPQQATTSCPLRSERDVEWNGEGMLVRLGDLGHTSLGCQVSSVLLFEDKLV